MTRYLLSLAIIIALIAGIVRVNIFYEDFTGQILSLIDEEVSAAENDKHDGSYILKAKGIWDNHRTLMSAVVPHDKIDTIIAQFSLCAYLSSAEENDDYLAELWQLKALITMISELDTPSLVRII